STNQRKQTSQGSARTIGRLRYPRGRLSTMTRDNKYGMVAFIVIVGVWGLFFWLAWEGVNYRKWFDITIWTLGIFGSVVLLHAERLNMFRRRLVFLAL